MGKIFSAVKTLVGGGSAPKASAPPVNIKPTIDTAQENRDKNRKKRASLFETSGGVSGQELNPDQVQKRQTLLGN